MSRRCLESEIQCTLNFFFRLKNRGIIGVIRVVDHMVWTEDTGNAANESQSSDLDRSYNAIDDLPTAFLKVAANYIGTFRNIFLSIFPEFSAVFFSNAQIY